MDTRTARVHACMSTRTAWPALTTAPCAPRRAAHATHRGSRRLSLRSGPHPPPLDAYHVRSGTANRFLQDAPPTSLVPLPHHPPRPGGLPPLRHRKMAFALTSSSSSLRLLDRPTAAPHHRARIPAVRYNVPVSEARCMHGRRWRRGLGETQHLCKRLAPRARSRSAAQSSSNKRTAGARALLPHAASSARL
eukprot:355871-Chlamydomonas_euryale.AAC.7